MNRGTALNFEIDQMKRFILFCPYRPWKSVELFSLLHSEYKNENFWKKVTNTPFFVYVGIKVVMKDNRKCLYPYLNDGLGLIYIPLRDIQTFKSGRALVIMLRWTMVTTPVIFLSFCLMFTVLNVQLCIYRDFKKKLLTMFTTKL